MVAFECTMSKEFSLSAVFNPSPTNILLIFLYFFFKTLQSWFEKHIIFVFFFVFSKNIFCSSSNEGVVTIATTNYPEHLDLALTDRPGRFDLKIMMDLPNSGARKYILLKYLEEFEYENLTLSKIVNKTDGLSGAYLREIVVTSYMIAQERGTQIDEKIMQEAADSVIEMKNNITPLNLNNSALYQ